MLVLRWAVNEPSAPTVTGASAVNFRSVFSLTNGVTCSPSMPTALPVMITAFLPLNVPLVTAIVMLLASVAPEPDAAAPVVEPAAAAAPKVQADLSAPGQVNFCGPVPSETVPAGVVACGHTKARADEACASFKTRPASVA